MSAPRPPLRAARKMGWGAAFFAPRLSISLREIAQVLDQRLDIPAVLAEERAELVALLERQPDAGYREIDHDELSVGALDPEVHFQRLVARVIVRVDQLGLHDRVAGRPLLR